MNDAKNLTEEQESLLSEIVSLFSPEDSAADLSILYQVTGYQGESQNFEFRTNYLDFDQLGGSKLVNQDKDEYFIAHINRIVSLDINCLDGALDP